MNAARVPRTGSTPRRAVFRFRHDGRRGTARAVRSVFRKKEGKEANALPCPLSRSQSRHERNFPRGQSHFRRTKIGTVPARRFSTGLPPPPGKREQTHTTPAPKRANVEGSGTGAGPLPKGTMLTPPAAAATGEPAASAAGLALAIRTPALPIDAACPALLLPKSVPAWTLDTRDTGPPTVKMPTLGRAAVIQHFQRAGQDRRAAGVVVADGMSIAVGATEDDRAAAGAVDHPQLARAGKGTTVYSH